MTVATRERPILFSGPMVRAILEGRKTQTRRIIKPQPDPSGFGVWLYDDEMYGSDEEMADHLFHNVYGNEGTPYGALYEGGGDRLWVRETWQQVHAVGGGQWATVSRPREKSQARLIYAADVEEEPPKWRPSIFMPRWASRITLEITDVRVQRLNEISEEDARAEGIDDAFLVRNKLPGDATLYAFRHLWDDINGDRGFGWDVNPWVWAISFKRLTKERQ